MLMRPAKCEAEARYHKAEAEAKKICETEAKLCEAKGEAEARDAILTINY